MPPPTEHILRPHHVGLLTILILTFKELDLKTIPSPFTLHLYRELLNEISEVSPPKSHRELLDALSQGSQADSDGARQLLASFQRVHADLRTPDQMINFFGSLPSLFVEKNEDEPPVLMRRSIFGFFCRRCFVSFIKFSFSGVVKLQGDYQLWCAGNSRAGYEPIRRDQLNIADQLIFKTQADKKSWAKPDAYEMWEKGLATGDEKIATENLRRFFEQHFHESNDSGVRQHALLNLVRMHYLRDEITAAHDLLSEAITVARTSGDKVTLQHCISMLHRLPPTISARRPVLNEIQPDLHPLEVLFDVKKLLDEQNGQPLSAAFVKIHEAIGLYDYWLDMQLALPMVEEQWAQHAVQSLVWAAAGCDALATIEENVVIAFTEQGGDDNNRITVLVNRAYKLARQGMYGKALTMLLEPDVWRGLSLHDYVSWAQEIWHILALRATRRGQHRLFNEFLIPRRPPGQYNPREYLHDAKSLGSGKIRDPLYEVIQMRRCDQATTAIEQLLKALWHSEFLSRLSDYRTGIILLADISLEFGLSTRSQRILEEIMPQIISGNDIEQRAYGCFTLARCIIAAGSSSVNALQDALPHLQKSESDFKTLELTQPLSDVQYLISVLYHNLGLEKERDGAAKRHCETETNLRRLEAIVVDNEILQILDVVGMVGAVLAGR